MTAERNLARSVWLFVVTISLAACGGSTAEVEDISQQPAQISMGGGALGGNAETTLLAREALADKELAGEVAWIAHEIQLGAGEALEHAHEFGFVYAKEGAHVIMGPSGSNDLEPTEGAAVHAGADHTHEALNTPSVFWEILLAAPGSPPPERGQFIFESAPLEGIPRLAQAVFVHVLVPSGGQTSVHTHPGPELIYHLTGNIEYENALIGSREMGPGEIEGIPPGVSVQKRNPFQADAGFLSWFLVDPTEPFASPAQFPLVDIQGENVALLAAGAEVAGVSSNFGNGSNDSAFGANRAFDGDPSTEWSSDGDGNEAWIEIELPAEAHVTTIGFWTRTMGASAEVFSFVVVTDRDEVYGPYDLGDAASAYYFDTDFTARRLRFEAVDSSGGNTGALEIEVYGEEAP